MSADPALFFEGVVHQIYDYVNSGSFDLLRVMDPLNPDTSPDSYDYVMRLQIVQGICFGFAALSFVFGVIFVIGRVLYNGFGGQEPRKSGYPAISVRFTEICYYVFSVVFLFCTALLLMGNSRMEMGISNSVRLYHEALPSLSSRQIAHMNRILDKNAALVDRIADNLVVDLQAQFSQLQSSRLSQSSNVVSASNDIERALRNISSCFIAMVKARANIEVIMNVHIPAIRNKWQDLEYEAYLERALNMMIEYGNMSDIDVVMKYVNGTIVQARGNLYAVDNLDQMANVIQQQLTTEYFDKNLKESLDNLWRFLEPVYDSLGYGTFRCKFAVQAGHYVSNEAASMVKFTKVMQLLEPIRVVLVPVVYVYGGFAIISTIMAGVAFPVHYPNVMYPSATLFSLGIITMWIVAGLLYPAAVTTSKTCAQPRFFLNTSIGRVPNSPLNASAESLNIPTCDACEERNLFVGCNRFSSNCKTVATQHFDISKTFLEPFVAKNPTGTTTILSALGKIDRKLRERSKNDVPSAKAPWDETLDKMRLSTNNSSMISLIDAMNVTGQRLVWETIFFHNNYVYLLKNTSMAMPAVYAVNDTMTNKSLEIHARLASLFDTQQAYINKVRSLYQSVPFEAGSTCGATSTKNPNQTTYNNLQNYMCTDASVGLDITWFFSSLSAIIAIPLVILTIRGYKVLVFRTYFEIGNEP